MQRSIALSSHQVELLDERARQVDPGLLTAIREVSNRLGSSVYLVGGCPRDLILSAKLGDLDLVVEGDGEKLATNLAEALGGSVLSHPRFGTARVEGLGEGIDVATTRREHYDSPAVLPRVEPGTLVDDLRRRDFSVNTLVVDLGEGPPYEILDSLGALKDIADGRLRVLHEKSFLDDPTRVLRGLRFENQLGFRMDEGTEILAREALGSGAFDLLSGDRLRREVFRLLEPANSIESILLRLDELGLLGILHPGLRVSNENLDWISRSALSCSDLPDELSEVESWRLGLPLLLESLDRTELEKTVHRLALRPEDGRWLLGSRETLERAIDALRRPAVKPHEVDLCLRPLRGEQIALLLAFNEAPVVQWTRRWLDELRLVKLSLTGQELLDAGCAPGPRIGRTLERVRAARLDGSISAEEELGCALDLLKSKTGQADTE